MQRKELMPDHRVFTLENGRKIGAHKNSCLFCKHNTDIFYDSDGPYMFFCDLGLDNASLGKDYVSLSFEGKCPKWESDGSEIDVD